MRYPHDCEDCTPLGEHGRFDLYYCAQGGQSPTVIARFGELGDYYSGLYGAKHIPALAEAKRRAEKAGLLPAGGTDGN